MEISVDVRRISEKKQAPSCTASHENDQELLLEAQWAWKKVVDWGLVGEGQCLEVTSRDRWTHYVIICVQEEKHEARGPTPHGSSGHFLLASKQKFSPEKKFKNAAD